MSTLSTIKNSQPARAGGAAVIDMCVLRNALIAGDRGAIESLVAGTGFFHPAEVAVAVELVDERLARGPASGYEFLLAELDGEVIGYACYGPIACTTGSYDLFWIAVDARFQRHGVGRLLMRAAETEVARLGGRRIYIDTSGKPQYEPTRAFYERNGFVCEARLVDFYAPGDDRVIFVNTLLSESNGDA